MVDKYLFRSPTTGRVTEKRGTAASGGVANAGQLVALDNGGKLDPTLFPVGFGEDLKTLSAAEALVAGDFVYINAMGRPAKASGASGGMPADGFVITSAASAAPVMVYFEGTNNALSGLVAGSRYYLSDTVPGGITATPVDGEGKLHQYLGKAISATELTFEPGDVIVLV